jgi:hypothetical protein
LAQFPSIFRNVCNSLSIVLIVPVCAPQVLRRSAIPKVSCGWTELLTYVAYSADQNRRGTAPKRNRLLWARRKLLGIRKVWWELLTEEPTSDLSDSYKVEATAIFFSNSVFDAADNVINATLA